MIDTDKYEGHTPARWMVGDAPDVIHPTVIMFDDPEWTNDFIITELVMVNGEEWTEEDYANARLIADAPILLEELKRAYQLIVDAAWQLHWNVGTIASSAHLSSKEWDEDIYAPAQAWRRQVQEILDASEEGCPWKESEEE